MVSVDGGVGGIAPVASHAPRFFDNSVEENSESEICFYFILLVSHQLTPDYFYSLHFVVPPRLCQGIVQSRAWLLGLSWSEKWFPWIFIQTSIWGADYFCIT